jgi:hypothetical protein
MTDPILRAETGSGPAWDDPSEDLLFELLTDLENGEAEFLIVERTADRTGNTYAQVLRNDNGLYQVEHRAGGPSQHFQAFTPDMRLAHRVITAWAFDLAGWREQLSWERLPFD